VRGKSARSREVPSLMAGARASCMPTRRREAETAVGGEGAPAYGGSCSFVFCATPFFRVRRFLAPSYKASYKAHKRLAPSYKASYKAHMSLD